jgi:hypothetical protein
VNKPCENQFTKAWDAFAKDLLTRYCCAKISERISGQAGFFLEMLTRSLKKGPSHKTDNKDILDLANCFHARNAVRTSQAVDTDPFEELTRSLYKDMFKGAL